MRREDSDQTEYPPSLTLVLTVHVQDKDVNYMHADSKECVPSMGTYPFHDSVVLKVHVKLSSLYIYGNWAVLHQSEYIMFAERKDFWSDTSDVPADG